jgi:DNA-damage-inducible protein D
VTDLDVFHFDPGKQNFEDYSQINGITHWSARLFMKFLGYEDWNSFHKAINRAIGTCTTLNIPVAENFIQCEQVIDGVACADYKLSRFACCLTALNGDPKKPKVAAAQAYFVSLADVLQKYFASADNVDRVMIREEITEREITLSGVAKSAGVEIYAYFQSAGYRGMYNMDYRTLKARKGVHQSRSLLDFMRKDELAANLFRLSLTEGRIKKDNVRGQGQLEYVAEDVGQKVRRTMIEETGIRPEDIPVAQDIRLVKKGLKEAHKELGKLDGKKKKMLSNSKE